MTTEIPRYEYLHAAEPYVSYSGRLIEPEKVFESSGWPPAGSPVKPLNRSAEKIHAFWLANHMHVGFPKSPRNAKLGAIYLPAQLIIWDEAHFVDDAFTEPGSRLLTGIRQDQAPPNMPLYRTQPVTLPPRRRYDNPRQRHLLRIGRLKITNDEVFGYAGWPTLDMVAMNEPAHRVVEYFERYGRSGDLLPSPWCLYAEDLVLPALELPPNQQATVRTESQVAFSNAAKREVEAATSGLPSNPTKGWQAHRSGAGSGINEASPLKPKS